MGGNFHEQPFYYVQLAPCSAGHLAIQLQQADFELMDPAGKWHAARIVNFKDSWIWWSKKYVKNGEFEGNAIELAADGVAEPVAVRYLFNSPWQGSVFNEASLPLGPFMMPTLQGNPSLKRD